MIKLGANMLSVQSLSVAYQGHVVLHDLNLVVKRGEILAVVGPNGVGKSTLVRALSGVVSPKRGRIILDIQTSPACPSSARA
jgi:branched-chain amino acid transport system ATP-binding protein